MLSDRERLRLQERLGEIREEMQEISKAGLLASGGASFSFRLRELEEEKERIQVQLGTATANVRQGRWPPPWAIVLGLVSLATLIAVIVSAVGT